MSWFNIELKTIIAVSPINDVINTLNHKDAWSFKLTALEKTPRKFVKRFDCSDFEWIANKTLFIFSSVKTWRKPLKVFTNWNVAKLLKIYVVHTVYSVSRPVKSLGQLVSDDWQDLLWFRYIVLWIIILIVDALLHIGASKRIHIIPRWIRQVAVDRNHLIPVNHSSHGALFDWFSNLHWW
jgi:hypothetical protein